MVMVMAGLNVAEAAPVSCTSTAPEVEVKVVKPVGAGTPWMPEKAAEESAGAIKVNEGASVSIFIVPSAFLAVMTVFGGSVALTAARYPGVPGAVETVVGLVPVVAVPSALTVAAIGAVADGFVTTGASSPPPHPPAIIKTPSKATGLNILNNFLILNTPLENHKMAGKGSLQSPPCLSVKG
jgi:hypothetical protein